MAPRLRRLSLRGPGIAWAAVALVLALAAIAGAQLGLAPRTVWQADSPLNVARWLTPVAAHLSSLHLWANLGGALLVGWLGLAARLPLAAAVAWIAAWPLTHAALGLAAAGWPGGPARYGGLSGVLHAGVGVAVVHLLAMPRGRLRWIGAGLLAGLALKLWNEGFWIAPLREDAAWGFPVAVVAHAAGAAAGVLCGGVSLLPWRPSRTRDRRGGDSRSR